MSSSSPLVAVVTGCTNGGIGHAVSTELLKRGCIVYATARRVDSMTGLEAAGAKLFQLDVTNEESCKAAISQVLQAEGRIDILVNNAGIGAAGPLLEFDIAQAADVFAANTLAPLRLSQLVAKSMAGRKQGLIVNIGSVVGEIPTPWAGIYSASKAALHSLSRTLELEVAHFGIQVLLVAAGGVKSGFGGSQLRSYQPPEDSMYASAREAILVRANAGQTTSIPAAVFASRLADQMLVKPVSKRPIYYSTGGNALLMGILRWLPWRFVRTLLKRKFRVGEVA